MAAETDEMTSLERLACIVDSTISRRQNPPNVRPREAGQEVPCEHHCHRCEEGMSIQPPRWYQYHMPHDPYQNSRTVVLQPKMILKLITRQAQR